MSRVDPFAGMRLNCTRCERPTRAYRDAGDPTAVYRCERCGKKHSTNSLEVT